MATANLNVAINSASSIFDSIKNFQITYGNITEIIINNFKHFFNNLFLSFLDKSQGKEPDLIQAFISLGLK